METSVKGVAAQKLNNEFNDIQLGIYKQQQVLNQSYMQAQQAQDQAKADSIANVYNQLVEKAMAKEMCIRDRRRLHPLSPFSTIPG